MESESVLLTIHKAVKVASQFRAKEDDDRFSLQYVRVRDKDVTATDGHTLLVVPVEVTGVSSDRLLDGKDAALVAHELPINSADIQPNPVVTTFPDIEKTLQEIRHEKPLARFGVQSAYLSRVGRAFKSMGVGVVEVVVRGPLNGIEFIGTLDGEVVATAIVMPVKLFPAVEKNAS